jgi:hypothetical protein
MFVAALGVYVLRTVGSPKLSGIVDGQGFQKCATSGRTVNRMWSIPHESGEGQTRSGHVTVAISCRALSPRFFFQ